MSYGFVAPVLNDKIQFPFIYRMIPKEETQFAGIVQLLLHFGWTWVSLFVPDNDNGERFTRDLTPLLTSSGICVAFSKTLIVRNDYHKLFQSETVAMWRQVNAYIYLWDSSYGFTPLVILQKKLDIERIGKKVWITTSFQDIASNVFSHAEAFQFFHGAMSFVVKTKRSPERDYYGPLPPGTILLWISSFDCSFTKLKLSLKSWMRCTEKKELRALPQEAVERILSQDSYSIYNSIQLLAHALHLACSFRSKWRLRSGDRDRLGFQRIQPWQFHAFLREVQFSNMSTDGLYLFEDGKLAANFDIVNWVSFPNMTYERVKIGSIEGQAAADIKFIINTEAIVWPMGFNKGIESFEEMAVHFTAFHGAGLGAIRSRTEGSAGRDYRGELWSCSSLASLDSAAAATATAAAEASASHLESQILPVTPSTASPVAPEMLPHEESTDEEDMEQESATLAGRQQVPWAGFEKVFTFVRQKGKNLVVQCNCCLPAIKHLSSAINSSSNLRKHLEVSFSHTRVGCLAAAAAVAADVAAEGLAGQSKRATSAGTRTTESPNVAEAQSREDSMNEEEAEQPPTASTAQQQEPCSSTEKESALSSESNATASAEAGTSQPEARIPPIIHSGESQIVETQPHEGSTHEEETETTSSTPASRQQDPFAGLEKAFTFVRQKGGSVLMQCNYCLPVIKNVSSAVNSATNLRKHLEKAHPEKLGAAENAGKGKKRSFFEELLDDDDDPPSIKVLKQQQQQQATLERWGSGKEQITQKILDRKIMDFIVDETLPLHTVDRPSFVGLVRLGLPKCLTIMCSKTLRDSIEKRVASMRERLLRRLGAVEYVATTADCWAYGKRRFLGVTAHWISPTTLEREFGALACKRLKGRHTYKAIEKTLRKVYAQYRIYSKVVCTTTDNGFNFVKAFRFFEAKEPADAADTNADDNDDSDSDDDDDDDDTHHCDDKDTDDEEETEVEFVPISEMLNAGNKAKEEAGDSEELGLPPHQQCASHTLNLVATQEVQAIVADPSPNSPLGPFRKHFCSLMGKCSKLWSRQEQSEQVAEYIHKQYGVYLIVPDKTRWHSTFEALKQLNELLSSVPLKLEAIMDQCSLERITPAEALALQEYTEVMGPLAQALDILQQDSGMFMGYLLPTLYNLDRKLQGLEKESGRYTYCLPLLKGVRKALRKQFAHIWEDKKLLLAACLHPRFKVDWLESAQNAQANRYMMEALLKAEIKGTVEEAGDGSLEKDPEGASLEDDFFNIQPQGKKSANEDSVDEEVARYLKSPSREVSLLHAFPRVMQSFLQYNTGMPSSAAIEQLFSTGGKVMTVKRHSLSDELFEQLVLLRQNRAVF
ncbi:hypothetical protein JD844_013922 [Phrynosoma platyrhinos]|uniref:BED-type domain-containing protein n=1 Tax=Phrynosoma platyrhinos TaxID=52577 RepID=A0ABQ7TLG6_PHRPL|nr:hypothetical protein JD844_013922 [Phrynosoma platyrhinos]